MTQAKIQNWLDRSCLKGTATSVRLLTTPAGKSRGAAIVQCADEAAVERVLLLNGQQVEGREVYVKRSDRPAASSKPSRPAEGTAAKRAEPQPRDAEAEARSVFVGNLSFDAKPENIGELFAGAGEVSSVRIAKDRKTGRSRGFAIVEFTQPGAVEKAVVRSGRMIRGRAVTVKPFGEKGGAA